ncbi:MAG: hypothetical protein MJA29_11180, partial [Candidatus Omnitrophica bacterium]|nr:hypothetical protein [Candidatus Omnitrophota bacterium]
MAHYTIPPHNIVMSVISKINNFVQNTVRDLALLQVRTTECTTASADYTTVRSTIRLQISEHENKLLDLLARQDQFPRGRLNEAIDLLQRLRDYVEKELLLAQVAMMERNPSRAASIVQQLRHHVEG